MRIGLGMLFRLARPRRRGQRVGRGVGRQVVRRVTRVSKAPRQKGGGR